MSTSDEKDVTNLMGPPGNVIDACGLARIDLLPIELCVPAESRAIQRFFSHPSAAPRSLPTTMVFGILSRPRENAGTKKPTYDLPRLSQR